MKTFQYKNVGSPSYCSRISSYNTEGQKLLQIFKDVSKFFSPDILQLCVGFARLYCFMPL